MTKKIHILYYCLNGKNIDVVDENLKEIYTITTDDQNRYISNNTFFTREDRFKCIIYKELKRVGEI